MHADGNETLEKEVWSCERRSRKKRKRFYLTRTALMCLGKGFVWFKKRPTAQQYWAPSSDLVLYIVNPSHLPHLQQVRCALTVPDCARLIVTIICYERRKWKKRTITCHPMRKIDTLDIFFASHCHFLHLTPLGTLGAVEIVRLRGRYLRWVDVSLYLSTIF